MAPTSGGRRGGKSLAPTGGPAFSLSSSFSNGLILRSWVLLGTSPVLSLMDGFFNFIYFSIIF